ncbi:MAG: hypothetical protein H7Y18_07865 [Clostridiaceae bacterium]|nr:hypothetical protein [Clostridiaceae bacterium]
MLVTISFNDVLLFVLSIAGIILLVYLSIAVSNINSILKDVKYIFDKNKNNIDNTILALPGIASNINGITKEIREGMQTIAATAETIEKNIAKSSSSIAEKTETAVDYVRIISEIIKTGIKYLEKRK